MPHSPQPQDADAPRLSRDWEAHLASELLRDSRITTLYGDAGAGKTTLLQGSLQPLLLRQCPTSEEVVAFFDQWDGDPSSALQRHLAALMGSPLPPEPVELVALLRGWHIRHGTRFLLLIDGFEACLQGAARQPAQRAFIDALVDVVNDAELPAHVLISLRSDAEPALLGMKQHIADFDRSWLRLPAWQRGPHQRPEPQPPVPLKLVPPAPPPAAMNDQITPKKDPIRREPVEDLASPPTEPLVLPKPRPRPPERSSAPIFKWLGAALGLGASVVLVVILFSMQRDDVQVASPAKSPTTIAPAALPAPTPEPPPRPPAPSLNLNAALGLTPPGVLAALNWPEGFQPLAEDPPLAVARYDALQAARNTEPAGSLQIVGAFLTEHLHVITRADSPMNALHEIEGRPIAIGPAQSADALTASTLYQDLFGKPLLAARAKNLTPDAALSALLDSRSVDAMVIAAPHPSDWLAGLSSNRRQAIKLLPLDADHPSARSALMHYLPSGTADRSVPALSVMSFLITSGKQTPASRQGLERFATRLCQQLPALKREGHAAWRAVNPALQLDVGWPQSSAVLPAWRNCPI